ncbi:OsmC family protein [Rhodohalobacter mucosus]|uniref:OsmC-like protein n=1 Tax=Rhodohalobacter mucosus TaxID=2079485 RepID=A0A316TXS4_9BACT|nr:OsmC family protein [Rhodohalobacter mucosus]PWN08135.1 hypothetical protein DDZ15_00430 [Rhodohalobacter mucosus]
MSDTNTIRRVFERNVEALEKRPSIGQSTGSTTVRLRNGTTCVITNGSKELVCDVGREQGGNDEGPGPGVLERGALGSCLAMGYSMWAAYLDIPVDHIEVHVESDFDARAMFGVGKNPPGFKEIRYDVMIESEADEETLQELIEKADAHSPVLDDFTRPVPVKRRVHIQPSRGLHTAGE